MEISWIIVLFVMTLLDWLLCVSCFVIGAQLMYCKQERKEPTSVLSRLADVFTPVATAEADEQQYGYYD